MHPRRDKRGVDAEVCRHRIQVIVSQPLLAENRDATEGQNLRGHPDRDSRKSRVLRRVVAQEGEGIFGILDLLVQVLVPAGMVEAVPERGGERMGERAMRVRKDVGHCGSDDNLHALDPVEHAASKAAIELVKPDRALECAAGFEGIVGLLEGVPVRAQSVVADLRQDAQSTSTISDGHPAPFELRELLIEGERRFGELDRYWRRQTSGIRHRRFSRNLPEIKIPAHCA